jgi:hypothetical protein
MSSPDLGQFYDCWDTERGPRYSWRRLWEADFVRLRAIFKVLVQQLNAMLPALPSRELAYAQDGMHCKRADDCDHRPCRKTSTESSEDFEACG